MRRLSFGLRACVGCCLIGLQLAAHADWRSKYVVPNQSANVSALAPRPEHDTAVLLVSVARAYELNGPRGRYCSPEVDIFNISGYILKDLVLKIDYFQTTAGNKRVFVGSTVTLALDVAPHASKHETFYVLDAANCNDLSGVARVQLCKASYDIDCTPDVSFSDAGRIPLRPGSTDAGDHLIFNPPRQAGSPPAH